MKATQGRSLAAETVSPKHERSDQPGPSRFPTTRWTLVISAGDSQASQEGSRTLSPRNRGYCGRSSRKWVPTPFSGCCADGQLAKATISWTSHTQDRPTSAEKHSATIRVIHFAGKRLTRGYAGRREPEVRFWERSPAPNRSQYQGVGSSQLCATLHGLGEPYCGKPRSGLRRVMSGASRLRTGIAVRTA